MSRQEYEARIAAWIDKILVQDVDGYWYAFVESDGSAWSEDMLVRLLAEMSKRNAATAAHHNKSMP